MQYKYSTFFRLLHSVVDYIGLNIFLIVSALLIAPESLQTSIVQDFRFHLILFNLFWFVGSTQAKLYDRVLNTEAIPTLKKTLNTLFIFALAPLVANLIIPGLMVDMRYLLPFLGIFGILIVAWKVLFLSIRKSQRRFWIDYKKIVILGSGQSARELLDFFRKNTNSGYLVQGYFDDEPVDGLLEELRYLGSIDNCVDYAKNNGVSEIFSALSSNQLGTVKSLMKQADNNLIRFRLVPDLTAFMDKNVLIDYYGALPILSPRKEPLEVKTNEVLKQVFDYTFAAIVTVSLLSWLIPIIAIAIKLDSRGPVFFRQLRSGKDNKPFFCLKFRSMHINGDANKVQASKGDKRITRVGSFLRRTSLDELPQFFNVLMGDMSIVGPRPHMLKHTENYSQIVNDFMVRHYATPGITGWAQVNGFRGETKETESMNKRVKADLWYIENWSFLLDLKIVFLTIYMTLKGDEKAY